MISCQLRLIFKTQLPSTLYYLPAFNPFYLGLDAAHRSQQPGNRNNLAWYANAMFESIISSICQGQYLICNNSPSFHPFHAHGVDLWPILFFLLSSTPLCTVNLLIVITKVNSEWWLNCLVLGWVGLHIPIYLGISRMTPAKAIKTGRDSRMVNKGSRISKTNKDNKGS